MANPIPVQLAVEDDLSEGVLRRLIRESATEYAVGTCYSHYGFGYLRKSIRGFNNGARGTPFVVLTDLDICDCAPTLIHDWLGGPPHPNLQLRVAVREVEAWLLADRRSFANFLGIREELIPSVVEEVQHPKETLIELAHRSRRRELRTDIVPRAGSTSKQGPNYNGRLMLFVRDHWRPAWARENSPSLHKAMLALDKFTPVW